MRAGHGRGLSFYLIRAILTAQPLAPVTCPRDGIISTSSAATVAAMNYEVTALAVKVSQQLFKAASTTDVRSTALGLRTEDYL